MSGKLETKKVSTKPDTEKIKPLAVSACCTEKGFISALERVHLYATPINQAQVAVHGESAQ